MRIINLVFVVLLSLVFAGCATSGKNSLARNAEKIELNNNSLLILTAELSNEYKTRFQPDAFGLSIETGIEDNVEKIYFPADKDLSLIHISEPTRRTPISYAVFCL